MLKGFGELDANSRPISLREVHIRPQKYQIATLGASKQQLKYKVKIQEEHISVQRTARFFTYGQAGKGTKRLWFVLHGYGMLASSIIKRLATFEPDSEYVVAPEGLSRFYWEGFGGKRVASWMTSEDRLNEIADYVRYLDALFQQILERLKQEGVDLDRLEINVVGFSQGTATTARWLAYGQSKVNNVVFWAGPLPEDVAWDSALPIFNACKKVLFMHGSEDPFIRLEHMQNHEKKLRKLGLDFEMIGYEGVHDIVPDGLEKMLNALDNG